ncbi:MAG: hypothetical protein GY862_05440 [Gammaproteobacteria bacterium]|nr:hypothetical protein [Gammaproteobacteria bacterium]
MYRLTYALILAGLLSGGCAVSDDPSEGGLMGGVYGLGSGRYEERVDERQKRLEAVKGQAQSAEEEKQLLTEEDAQATQEREVLAKEVKQLTGNTRKLSKKVKRLKSSNAAKRKEKVKLQKRVDKVNAQLAKLQGASGNMTVEEYKKKATQLRKEINDLWTIANSL